MKQKIEFEIDVPEGKKVVLKDNKVVFEDIEPQLPKTWKEFCKQNKIKEGEYYLDYFSKIKEVNVRERLDISDRIVLPNKQAAEQHLALMQLHQLRDCYRQGWIPTNYNERHCIVNSKQKYWITSELVISCFLSFQSEEIAKQFLNNFKDLIKQAGDLI